jgi:hypothetical protein
MDTRTWAGITLGVAFAAVMLNSCGPADSNMARVDANIVTGVDVSASINASELQMQLDGITIAMQSPVIQAAIRHGRHRQIGFAVYLWSAGCAPVIEWRIIASAEDAAAMAVNLKEAIKARGAAQGEGQSGGLTDISNALLCGANLLQTSPFASDRDVINIVTNGSDNVGALAQLVAVQEQLKANGTNVNAVAMPGGEDHGTLVPYLQQNVVTGPFPFVIPVSKPEDLLDAWRKKFVGEIS